MPAKGEQTLRSPIQRGVEAQRDVGAAEDEPLVEAAELVVQRPLDRRSSARDRHTSR
jgi:hypothetical protein